MANMTRTGTKKHIAEILAAKEAACAEISNMLPRFRELMAEQEAAKHQIRIEDDKRFSKIVDVEVAKLESEIRSIKKEQGVLETWIERLETTWIERVQKRKKKK